MSYATVDVSTIGAEVGPHPAASPFDKDIGRALGVTAFGLYRVELPPGAATVEHDHVEDREEDAYLVLAGSGVVVVDGEEVPVVPGQAIAVTPQSRRQVRAGDDGLVLIAVCAAPAVGT